MKFLNDLLRDLRDRRLLPVALGLLAATVAVPIVLASSPATKDGQGPGADASASATRSAELALETEPVLALDQSGLRDYRRRLRVFRAKNPFVQHVPEATRRGLKKLLGNLSAELSKQSSGGASAVSTGGGSLSSGAGTLGGGSSSASAPGTTTVPSAPKLRVFTHRVDLRFGKAGQDSKLREGLKAFTLLPIDTKSPVISFLGVTEDERSAVFLVATEAAADGDGACRPSKSRCLFVRLEPGQTELLVVGAGTGKEVTWELKLEKIVRKFKDEGGGKKASSKSGGSKRSGDGSQDQGVSFEPDTGK